MRIAGFPFKGCGTKKVAGATGLEPAISGLTGRRDNQLRYAPVTKGTINETFFYVNGVAHAFRPKNVSAVKAVRSELDAGSVSIDTHSGAWYPDEP